MKAVIAQNDQKILICNYMEERTGANFDPKMCQGFAIMSDDNVFCGAVLVSNVREHNGKVVDCEVSIASEVATAWRPEPCRAIFYYIFKQLGCVRCTCITKKNNLKARKFMEAMNFQLEGNVRKGYDGEKDALIYGLLAEDCTFLEDLNSGEEVRP